MLKELKTIGEYVMGKTTDISLAKLPKQDARLIVLKYD
jgi:hypothetical protein